MSNLRFIFAAGCLFAAKLCLADTQLKAPVAEIRPETLTTLQDTRVDNYRWLRDDSRQNAKVIDYLKAENAYSTDKSKAWQPLAESIYQEMSARQEEQRYIPPYTKNGWTYQSRYPDQANYPVIFRQQQGSTEWQEVVDANARGAGKAFYRMSGYAVSEDNRFIAVAEDLTGDSQSQISLLDTATNQWLTDSLLHTSGNMVFSPDGKQIYYVVNDEQTLTPNRVMRHILGSQQPDTEIYFEADGRFFTGIARSASGDYLLITLSGNDLSEVRALSLADPEAGIQTIRPRAEGVEYYADHFEGRFYLRSNHQDKNFAIYTARQPGSDLQLLVAPEKETLIESFDLLGHWLIITKRSEGKTQFAKYDLTNGQWQTLQFPDASYMARQGSNTDSSAKTFNYIYSSLNRPLSYEQWDLASGHTQSVHQRKIADYQPGDYDSKLVFVTARDGESIPVSLVWRKDRFHEGKNPLLVYGYGAYGMSLDAAFSAPRLSLLDRGFVFALAHVRGGGEKGVNWYQRGKLRHKQNSFNDFIDSARGLVTAGYGAKQRVYAMGGSAGGLLVAAAVNQAPELFSAAVLQVPFVDVLNTMLDSSLPLTQQEYAEWGNPATLEYYSLIKSYSPYDNLAEKSYPDMLITTGLNDTQVPYWEAAKYIARLRAVNQNPQATFLLNTNMNAGHGGRSGRYSRLQDSASAFSFLIFIDQQKNKNSGVTP